MAASLLAEYGNFSDPPLILKYKSDLSPNYLILNSISLILRDMICRCDWCGNDAGYTEYHDTEWGKPSKDDKKLFEFLILESAQAGLSWITILRKRQGYKTAFCNFDFEKVAEMTPEDEARLMNFDGIVKNRLKIHAAIVNARLFKQIIKEYGSFYNYISTFFSNKIPVINDIPDISAIPVTSPEAIAISKDMKKRGFKFFGPTICYSFLQATGFIDDHINNCQFKTKLS